MVYALPGPTKMKDGEEEVSVIEREKSVHTMEDVYVSNNILHNNNSNSIQFHSFFQTKRNKIVLD
jgi:hypothetical protein